MSTRARKPIKPAKRTSVSRQSRAAAKPVAQVAAASPPAAAEPATELETGTTSPATVSQSEATAGLRLEPSCLLRDALDLQFHLLSADFGDGEVRVDGSAVERVDTAGLQLLVAFVQHHTSQGRVVSWTRASEVLSRSAARLGLTASLNLAGCEERAS